MARDPLRHRQRIPARDQRAADDAKDLRTWRGTVKAATELADAGPQPTKAKRKKAVAHTMKEVADLLGNTSAVARSSYVDPRVVDHFENGTVVEGDREKDVRDLLSQEP